MCCRYWPVLSERMRKLYVTGPRLVTRPVNSSSQVRSGRPVTQSRFSVLDGLMETWCPLYVTLFGIRATPVLGPALPGLVTHFAADELVPGVELLLVPAPKLVGFLPADQFSMASGSARRTWALRVELPAVTAAGFAGVRVTEWISSSGSSARTCCKERITSLRLLLIISFIWNL